MLGAVVVLWVTEALPLAVTALLGASVCVLLQVAPAKEVFAPFADPLMFLFIGAFILSRAIFLHGLDRRVAYAVLSLPWVGARPSRILLAFGAVTAFISWWISNTATTAMMFGIGLSILAALRAPGTSATIDPRYATGLMLMTSFAASIGGLATPVGTPPNVIGLGFIRSQIGRGDPVLPLDADRGPDRPRAIRVPVRLPQRCRAGRRSRAARGCRADPPGARTAWPLDPGAALGGDRVRGDGGALDSAGRRGHSSGGGECRLSEPRRGACRRA